MTDRNDLPEYGGWGGNDFGRHSCPDGEVIKTISGRAGQAVDQICARCTDGTELGCYGGGNGSPWSRDGPFTSAYGRSGDGVDSLFGSGGNGGNGWSGICPTGKYLTGIRGRGADLVDSIGFECGIDKKQHCIDHLEDPVCNNISADILNKACAKNMTATCKNRKNELNESTIAGYCPAHLDDPFCSCYKPAPSYIPNEIRGLTNCWNQTCATSGYIPVNMRQVCPNICIAKQDLGASGDSNILTGNINVQETCNTTINQPGVQPGPQSGNGNIQGPVDLSALTPKTDNTLIYILIIAVALVISAYLAFGSNDNSYPPMPYQQPVQPLAYYPTQ
jgi:hypothetical protein